MIDLTPLDVRKKKGDFAKILDLEDASAVPDVEEVQEPGIAESEQSGA